MRGLFDPSEDGLLSLANSLHTKMQGEGHPYSLVRRTQPLRALRVKCYDLCWRHGQGISRPRSSAEHVAGILERPSLPS